MLDTLSWFVKILNAAVGIAATVLTVFAAFIAVVLIKRASEKSNIIVSYLAALLLFLALYREAVLQTYLLYTYKSLLFIYFAYAMTKAGRVFLQRITMLNLNGFNFYARKIKLVRDSNVITRSDYSRTLTPSFPFLKTSAVIIQ